MRTTVDLNDRLMADALKWVGESTKTGTINESMKIAVAFKKRMKLLTMAGKVKLDVDLNATRNRK
jgi:Arc/MetJ family transcription regulator